MMTLRHIRAAEVRHQQKKSERERQSWNVNEQEKEKNPNRKREIGIFSMVGFDSATSSFLALLVIISYRKNRKKQN